MVFDIFRDLLDAPPKQRARPRFGQKSKDMLYQHQGGKCAGCNRKMAKRDFDIDHIIPFSRGGKDTPDNLQLLCGSCNRMKGAGTQAELKRKLKAQGLLKTPKSSSKASAPQNKSAAKKKASPRSTTPQNQSRRKPNNDPLADLLDIFS